MSERGSHIGALLGCLGNTRNVKKPNSADRSVAKYLANVPEPSRSTLNKVRAAIRSVVPPEATETLSYQIPTFKYKGALVAFAAFTNHCSFFPMSMPVMRAFKNDLKKLETSKGTIRFHMNKPLSAGLIRKLVKARIAENKRGKRR